MTRTLRRIAACLLCLALLPLAACSTAREAGYKKAADGLNSYCDNRDEVTRDAVVGRINRGLRDAGARAEVKGIACDPPAS